MRSGNKGLYRAGAAWICAGLLYGYVLIPLGLRIPCPFRAVTGLRCPGCGVTDFCLAVLHGRFWEAWHYNWGLALALPALGWLVWHRVRRGCWDRRLSLALAAALLAWGVIRNIAGL